MKEIQRLFEESITFFCADIMYYGRIFLTKRSKSSLLCIEKGLEDANNSQNCSCKQSKND